MSTVHPFPPLGVPTHTAPQPTNGATDITTTRCASGQSIRKCSVFEGMAGGMDFVQAPLPSVPRKCYCQGYGGQVKRFTLVLTNESVASPLIPGYARPKLFVNGTSPGPTLNVTQFDWLEITVINQLLQEMPMHWHGLIQLETPYSDGAAALSQCSIPPGMQVVYRFRASQSGTYWYHSHKGVLYTDGIIGSLVINRLFPDPRSPTATLTESQYYGYSTDFDLMLVDFYNQYAGGEPLSYYLSPDSGGAEPTPDAIAVNGRFSANVVRDLNLDPSQYLFSLVVNRHSKSRIRFTGSHALSMFQITLDGVVMEVIETDGTTTVPAAVPSLVVSGGQRFSILADWSVVPSSVNAVYLRVSAMTDMYASNISFVPPYEANVSGAIPLDPNWIGIIYFSDSSPALPPASAADIVPANYDPDSASFIGTGVLPPPSQASSPPDASNFLNLVPLDRSRAPEPDHFMYTEIDFFTAEDGQLSAEGVPLRAGVNYASFNNLSSFPAWKPPLLYDYYDRNLTSIASFTIPSTTGARVEPSSPSLVPIYYNANAQYNLPTNAVIDHIIFNTDAGPHPIHKHTYPFWLVSSSEYPEAEDINRDNYPRRDVVSVPAGGWAKLRFVVDVPGIFPQHCHIDWHKAAGLFLTQIYAGDQLMQHPKAIPPDFLALCGQPSRPNPPHNDPPGPPPQHPPNPVPPPPKSPPPKTPPHP